MKKEIVFKIFEELQHDTLSFFYQGGFSDEITDMIINLSNFYLEQSEFSKLRNRVSFLMVECFQNIIRHGDEAKVEKHNTISDNLFFTRNIGNTFFITSVNPIENEHIPPLRSKLQNVNTLSPAELKSLHSEVLKNESLTNKGGASLGLIEMARKSGQKLEFDFEKIDDHKSHFYLQVKINSDAVEEAKKLPMQDCKRFHKMIDNENVFLLQKGNFSQESIKPLLRMVDNNLHTNSNPNKNSFHVLVEMLQNISKHAYKINDSREGVFLMGEEDNKFYIGTGNFVQNSKVAKLKTYLDDLQAADFNQLQEKYKNILMSGDITEGGGAGLGLVDIYRYGKAEFDIIPFDQEKSFFLMLSTTQSIK